MTSIKSQLMFLSDLMLNRIAHLHEKIISCLKLLISD